MRFKISLGSKLKSLFVVSLNLSVYAVNIYFKNMIYLHGKIYVDFNCKLLSFENRLKLSRMVLY